MVPVKEIFNYTCSCCLKVSITSQMDKNKKLKKERCNQKEHSENSSTDPPLLKNLKFSTGKGACTKENLHIEIRAAKRNKDPKLEISII